MESMNSSVHLQKIPAAHGPFGALSPIRSAWPHTSLAALGSKSVEFAVTCESPPFTSYPVAAVSPLVRISATSSVT